MTGLKKENKKVITITRMKAIFLCATMIVFAFILGYLISGIIYTNKTQKLISGIVPTRENNFNYHFIYPLLSIKYGNARNFIENTALEKQINNYVQTQYQNNNANSVSVYYRNLLNNQWAGVNADIQYHPGSMMKVVVMMTYYRESQIDPTILQKNLVYSSNISQQITSTDLKQQSDLIVGKSYTVEQLIESMIQNSDNGAISLLLNNINHKILDDVFNDLNIKNPDDTSDFTISATEYANFLRILYNATYLTEDSSEQALKVMSQSTFQKGISAGVPSNVVTSQKYGEYVDTDTTGKYITAIELSNCGIIYAQDNPYELCVMTKSPYSGNGSVDEQRLTSILKDVSSIVYSYVDSNSKK